MNGCCSTIRPDDGVLDRVVIERALAGRPVSITPRERRIVILRLAQLRGWGVDRISEHTGYARTKVALTLQQARR